MFTIKTPKIDSAQIPSVRDSGLLALDTVLKVSLVRRN